MSYLLLVGGRFARKLGQDFCPIFKKVNGDTLITFFVLFCFLFYFSNVLRQVGVA